MEEKQMSVEVILDNEYVTLWYYPEAGIVHHKFKKYIHGERFREAITRAIETLEQRGGNKWLADDRLNSALSKDEYNWVSTVANPRMLAAGWKYWALIYPDKKPGRTNLDYYVRASSGYGIFAQAFDDVAEAVKWLESVE
jgi:hypothetical protein